MVRGRKAIFILIFCFLPLTLKAYDQDFVVWKKLAFFVVSWVEKVNSNFQYTQENPQIFQVNNFYIARFSKINPETISFHLKKSTNGYLGILEYDEVIYQSQSLNLTDLKQKPFTPIKIRRLTEIFRYNGSNWQ